MPKAHYATEGKPLSQTAIYQQKLKLGMYTNPVQLLGVQLNASDTAALLAALADLTVKPAYERTVAADAQRAATQAKPAAAADTELVALLVKTEGTGIPLFNSGNIYNTAAKHSSSTMTLRIHPQHNQQRGGLATESLARRAADSAPSQAAFDILKVTRAANSNSLKLLNSRFNPNLDYRSGLSAHAHPLGLDEDEEHQAGAAAAALLREGYTHDVALQKRLNTFTAALAINPLLLAAANKLAEERLKLILLGGTPQDFRNQAQLYASALLVAQKRSDERMKNHREGKINLGLGASTTEAELMAMAQKIVNPVLHDIDTKAASQREHHEALRQEKEHLQAQHKLAKQEEKELKAKEKAELEAAKQQRIAANELQKAEANTAHEEEIKALNLEVENDTRDLRATEEKYEKEKEELLAEKAAKQEEIDAEEAEKKAERERELKQLQEEKDELLKPTLDELDTETKKRDEVVNARDEHQKEHDHHADTNAELKDKIAALEKRLQQQKDDIAKYTTDLETAKSTHDTTAADLTATEERHTKKLADNKEAAAELDREIEQLQQDKKSQLLAKAQHRKQIEDHIDGRVRDERKIQQALPEHLRSEVDEDQLRDTSLIFTVEEPEVKEEPKVEAKEAKEDAHDAKEDAKDTAKDAAAAATEPKHTDTAKTELKPAKAAAKEAHKKEEGKIEDARQQLKAKIDSDVPKLPKKELKFRRLSSIFKSKDVPPAKPFVEKGNGAAATKTTSGGSKASKDKATTSSEAKSDKTKNEALAEKASAKADQLAEKVLDKADKVSERVADRSGKVADKVAERSEKVSAKADEAADKVGDKADKAADKADQAEAEKAAKKDSADVTDTPASGTLKHEPTDDDLVNGKKHAGGVFQEEI